METRKLSKKVMERLPIYLSYLKSLPEELQSVSATAIAKALGLGDVQVRKDLAKISDTGHKRTGRNRKQLIQDIEAFLDLTAETGSVVVGAGKLGKALLNYGGFQEFGLNIMAGFDLIPDEVGQGSGKPIYPISRLESFCKRHDIHIGIIAVPAESAQSVCDGLVACGVKAIWNLAPVHLKVPNHVVVENQNLAVSFASLSVRLRERQVFQ